MGWLHEWRRVFILLGLISMIGVVTACATDSTNAPAGETQGAAPETPQSPDADSTAPDAASAGDAEWQQVLEAAKKENLKIVVQPGVQDEDFINDFKKAYPDLNVEFMGLRPSDAGPRIITEQQNNQFYWDVMVASTSNKVSVLSPADAFQDIRPFLPDHSDDEWYGGFELYAQNVTNKPWTFIFTTDLHATLFVNRDQLTTQQFNSLDDLLDPSLKGKIVIHTPKSQSTGSLALAGILNIKDEDFIEELLTAQDPVFVDDQSIAADWVAEGRYPIGIGLDRPRLQELQSAGVGTSLERLDFPGQSTLSRGISVFRNNPSPNATKVFVHWVLSDEGQISYTQSRGNNSRKKSVPLGDPDIAINWDQYDNYSLQGTEKGTDSVLKIIELYNKHY